MINNGKWIYFGDYDADTYKYDPMDKLPVHWEKENEYNHGNNFHNQQKPFFSVFPLFGCHAWEGVSSPTLAFESTHGRKI